MSNPAAVTSILLPVSDGVLPTVATSVTLTNGSPLAASSASRSTNPCGAGMSWILLCVCQYAQSVNQLLQPVHGSFSVYVWRKRRGVAKQPVDPIQRRENDAAGVQQREHPALHGPEWADR